MPNAKFREIFVGMMFLSRKEPPKLTKEPFCCVKINVRLGTNFRGTLRRSKYPQITLHNNDFSGMSAAGCNWTKLCNFYQCVTFAWWQHQLAASALQESSQKLHFSMQFLI